MLKEAKSGPNLYDVLGISSAAGTPEIKAAFRRLAKSSHPDFNADDTMGNRRFHQVHLAYRVLCDTQMRAHYDRHLQWVRFLSAPRSPAVPPWRRFGKEVALVAALIIGLTPVFVLGIRAVAPDRLAAIVSQWSGGPNPPPTDPRQSADRSRPSSTRPAAIEVQSAPIEPMVAKAAEPPSDPTNGASASPSALMPEGLAAEALVPDRAAGTKVDEKRERAAAYAFAEQQLPSLKLAAEMPCGCDHPPSTPGRAADAPSAVDDRGTLDQARRLVQQGERYAAEGNLAVARRYFVRAADLGLAIAATKMAETFEGDALARHGVRGVTPNPAEAANWRRRALELDARQSEASAPKTTE